MVGCNDMYRELTAALDFCVDRRQWPYFWPISSLFVSFDTQHMKTTFNEDDHFLNIYLPYLLPLILPWSEVASVVEGKESLPGRMLLLTPPLEKEVTVNKKVPLPMSFKLDKTR
jgi:hypothetical protein